MPGCRRTPSRPSQCRRRERAEPPPPSAPPPQGGSRLFHGAGLFGRQLARRMGASAAVVDARTRSPRSASSRASRRRGGRLDAAGARRGSRLGASRSGW
eukprot:5324425-Prymnesium_polylepis.1